MRCLCSSSSTSFDVVVVNVVVAAAIALLCAPRQLNDGNTYEYTIIIFMFRHAAHRTRNKIKCFVGCDKCHDKKHKLKYDER